jgi:hypothetical protein
MSMQEAPNVLLAGACNSSEDVGSLHVLAIMTFGDDYSGKGSMQTHL